MSMMIWWRTPIGNDFQIHVEPFRRYAKACRAVKPVWNPDLITDKGRERYCKRIEEKFDKPLINEEAALRLFMECRLSVKKVLAELKNKKACYKSFFEMKQKPLRSRVCP